MANKSNSVASSTTLALIRTPYKIQDEEELGREQKKREGEKKRNYKTRKKKKRNQGCE